MAWRKWNVVGAAEIGAAVGVASWVVANNIPAFLGTKPAAPPGQWLELVVAALIAALVPALAFAGVAGLQNLLLWRVRIGIGATLAAVAGVLCLGAVLPHASRVVGDGGACERFDRRVADAATVTAAEIRTVLTPNYVQCSAWLRRYPKVSVNARYHDPAADPALFAAACAYDSSPSLSYAEKKRRHDARLTAYGDDVAQACRFRLMQAAIDEARRVAVDPLMVPTDVAAAPQ
jgi:hypothetical protein